MEAAVGAALTTEEEEEKYEEDTVVEVANFKRSFEVVPDEDKEEEREVSIIGVPEFSPVIDSVETTPAPKSFPLLLLLLLLLILLLLLLLLLLEL